MDNNESLFENNNSKELTEEIGIEKAEDPALKAPSTPPFGKRILGGVYDFVELFTLAGAIILVLFTFFFRLSIVDGGSMEQTLHNGDRVLVSDTFYTPRVGDIVVVQCPTDLKGSYATGKLQTHKAGNPLIKRIIAVAGDEVEVRDYGKVYVNGVLSDESYVYEDHVNQDYPQYKITVPEGMVFVAGDHRNASFDGRVFGPVDIRCIQGRAFLRISPDFGRI